MDMTHEDLNSIGVTAFGHRHKIFKKIKEMSHTGGSAGTVHIETIIVCRNHGHVQVHICLHPVIYHVAFMQCSLHVQFMSWCCASYA